MTKNRISETFSSVAWPPEYKIRKHRRARRVTLRAATNNKLEITVPYRFNITKIQDILEEHKDWILKQLHLAHLEPCEILPEKLYFYAVKENWLIHYIASDHKLELFHRPGNEIVLFGRIDEIENCKNLLINWIKQQAILYLPRCLENISKEIGLTFQAAIVRDQRTLWGSCNVNKIISLNYRLLFLPENLLRYVLIHELAHTIYLNHSNHFWRLVQTFDPEWRTHRKALRRANQYLPRWM